MRSPSTSVTTPCFRLVSGAAYAAIELTCTACRRSPSTVSTACSQPGTRQRFADARCVRQPLRAQPVIGGAFSAPERRALHGFERSEFVPQLLHVGTCLFEHLLTNEQVFTRCAEFGETVFHVELEARFERSPFLDAGREFADVVGMSPVTRSRASSSSCAARPRSRCSTCSTCSMREDSTSDSRWFALARSLNDSHSLAILSGAFRPLRARRSNVDLRRAPLRHAARLPPERYSACGSLLRPSRAGSAFLCAAGRPASRSSSSCLRAAGCSDRLFDARDIGAQLIEASLHAVELIAVFGVPHAALFDFGVDGALLATARSSATSSVRISPSRVARSATSSAASRSACSCAVVVRSSAFSSR